MTVSLWLALAAGRYLPPCQQSSGLVGPLACSLSVGYSSLLAITSGRKPAFVDDIMGLAVGPLS